MRMGSELLAAGRSQEFASVFKTGGHIAGSSTHSLQRKELATCFERAVYSA
jgi:hypothetical protein